MPLGPRFEREGDRHFQARRFRQALRCYDRALREGADPLGAIENRWATLMLLGHFERAWQETDRTERLRREQASRVNEKLPRHFQRVWNGESLNGRYVRVCCYHGLGDTLQFARYLPLLAEVAASIEVECQPELRELLSLSFPSIRICSESECSRESSVVCVELMELAYALRTTVETIPRRVPYLHLPTEMVAERRRELRWALDRQRVAVGLVWSSGLWNPARNIAVEELRPLAQIPGIAFVNLQSGGEGLSAAVDLAGAPHNRESTNRTIVGTAATILSLDLVIAVDTMAAHLAGALGKPVWTLLSFHSDWRWMAERDDSPWYPTMRLLRQRRVDDWTSVVQQLNARLQRMARSRPQRIERAA